MILKTYTRILSTDIDATLRTLVPLHHGRVHVDFHFGDWRLVGIGDILVVSGEGTTLDAVRDTHGPWIVDNLDATIATLLENDAEIMGDVAASPTGRFIYARHLDGCVVEYVEWKADLVEQFIEAPQRAGLLASQL